jgi:hypothetical protein
MTFRHRIAVALVAPAVAVTGFGVAIPSATAAPSATWLFTNCTNLHTRWAHGVGRRDAVDHTTGTPVTNFKHSNRLYRRAMNQNSGLDADKDKIACESA